MNKYFSLLLIPLFLIPFINHASAADTPMNIPPVEKVDLITSFEEIQSERKLLKEQIQAIEKDIDSIVNPEKEQAINKKMKLYMQDYKMAAKETAYRKAIEIQQPRYFETVSTESDLFSVPEKLLSGIAAPNAYIKYYVAAGEKYDVEWTVLAAIHKIETNYSTHPSMISSVGAVGHMQFMPTTWNAYGIDADGDGKRSPWSLPDAIYSAAHYLSANGFSRNPRSAIWYYNHADWYVNDVIETAARIRKS